MKKQITWKNISYHDKCGEQMNKLKDKFGLLVFLKERMKKRICFSKQTRRWGGEIENDQNCSDFWSKF